MSDTFHTQLMSATSLGHWRKVKKLLASEHIPQRMADAALDSACASARPNALKSVQLLLKAGADIRHGSDAPLRSAITANDFEVVLFMLDNGADPNALGGMPIYDASNHADSKILQLLLKRGASATAESLQHAAYRNNTVVLQNLIAAGADPQHARSKALQIAYIHAHRESIDLLFPLSHPEEALADMRAHNLSAEGIQQLKYDCAHALRATLASHTEVLSSRAPSSKRM